MLTTSKSYLFSIILFAATIFLIFLIDQRGEPTVVNTNLENIPYLIGDYQGSEDFFSDSVYEELNADKHVYRHYHSLDGTKQIDLYIGYYGTAKGGRTGHNPYACLPSSGWGIIKTDKVKIYNASTKKMVVVNAIIAQKNRSFETVLHWYQSDKKKVLSSGVQQNIQRFISRITKNRNDGAFIRVSALSDKEGLGSAEKNVIEFAKSILAIVPNYWPEEK